MLHSKRNTFKVSIVTWVDHKKGSPWDRTWCLQYRNIENYSILLHRTAWWSPLHILPLAIGALWKQANFVKLYIRVTKHKVNTYDEYLSQSDNCVSISIWPDQA